MIGERFIQVDKTSKIPNGEVKNILEYKKWQKFINVIENAKIACEKINYNVLNHFTVKVFLLISIISLVNSL